MTTPTAHRQMISRCYDPNHPKYKNYGGRGIRVCDRWICYRLFLEDMGVRPKGMSLNRIDNNGNYCPENCEWATEKAQQQNRQEQIKSWGNCEWIECPDGKHRAIEPSIPLLVDGFSNRRPILHAIGNAIVPQVAAEFIKATM